MVTVARSTVIDAPVDAVWAVLRDFNGHDRWHPAVAESRIEEAEPADRIGAVRRFRLADGGVLREQLLALDDRTRSFTYCLLEAPLPLHGYVATVALRPVTLGDATFWHWQSRFDPPPGEAERLVRLVGDAIYAAGFEAIRAILARPARTLAARPAPPDTAPDPVADPVADPLADGAPEAETAGTIHARAIVVRSHGGPEVLATETVAVPPPGPGEIRLAQAAAGVNFIDVHGRQGSSRTLALPGIPGLEGAGRVTDVGAGVTRFRAGDRVAYAGGPAGAYASHRLLPADVAVPLPDDIDAVLAGASLLRGMTAAALLTRVHRVGPDDRVLVHAAAGGTGRILAQWARALGARVIGTVSDPARIPVAAAVCDAVIDRGSEDVAARVRTLTDGAGASVVYDGIGRASFAGSVAALGPRGHLVLYGRVSGPVGAQDLEDLGRRSLTVSRPNFADYADSAASRQALADAYFAMLRRGAVQVDIARRLPLDHAAEAHRLLEAGTATGLTALVF
ncbi:MAG: SRPBCC family protein [Alphaproteobacteria bacterium]